MRERFDTILLVKKETGSRCTSVDVESFSFDFWPTSFSQRPTKCRDTKLNSFLLLLLLLLCLLGPFSFLGLMAIDLNTIGDEALEDPPTYSPSASLSGSPSSSICLELWHACAGPLTSLPRKGGLVVYFPQGHLEQAANYCPKVAYNLPPHVFCRVIDVKLHVRFLFSLFLSLFLHLQCWNYWVFFFCSGFSLKFGFFWSHTKFWGLVFVVVESRGWIKWWVLGFGSWVFFNFAGSFVECGFTWVFTFFLV